VQELEHCGLELMWVIYSIAFVIALPFYLLWQKLRG
jgi:hypothetical protein